MANIRLKELLEANVDPKLVARSKESGKLVYFKTQQAKDAALKSGSHLDPKAEKGANPKADAKPNDMFGADYAKNRGGEAAPKVNLPKKASELDDTHAESLEKAINAEVGLNGFVDTDDYTDAIIYTASTGNEPTYTLYFGSNSDYGKPDEFRVTFASTAIDNDPSNIGNKFDKSFKSAEDAMKYTIALAKKYKKELEMDDAAPKADTDWMSNLDSIDTSDIKGKADPNADSFTSNDLYGATFKDPQTGKTITVGDAYEREDDSPAYQKAFAYVAKFDPDKEAVMGTQAYADLNKQDASVDGQTDDELYDALSDMGYDFGELGSDDFDENGFADAAMNLGYRWDNKNKVWNHRDMMGDKAPKADTPKSNLPKKASQLKYKHSESLEKAINTETGLEGIADIDDNGAITYTASNGSMPTYTLYMGSNIDYGNPDEFRVSLESTYANDPADLSGKIDKTFKSADEAMAFTVAIAKKYKKELKMDIDDDVNESTKLTSMIKK